MIQPLSYFDVAGAPNLIAPDAIDALQFLQPPIHECRRIVVVWVEKAREESRGPAKPPLVVRDGPKHGEQQPRLTGHAAHALGLGKLRLDGSNARHCSSPEQPD